MTNPWPDPIELTELRGLALRVSSRIVGRFDDAEDVAQEAVLRAAKEWSRIRDYSRPWVVRVATNLAIAQLRRDGRRPPLVVQGDAADRHADVRVDLDHALRALPERQRQAVVLRYLADLDEATVAELLGCSRGSVKRHLHRAVHALRSSTRLANEVERKETLLVDNSHHWSQHGFTAAVEPPTGWPDRPWDHWLVHQSGSRDRVAVDKNGVPVLDADGDEVMSGPGFDHEVVKILPRTEPDPPELPDPRPLVSGDLTELLNSALEYAAFFGHPWVGDEHLGLALAARGQFPAATEERLGRAVAVFYEGPWAERRLEIVRARQTGSPFPRQPEANFSWNRSLNRTLRDASTTSPEHLALHLIEHDRSLIRLLLERCP